MEEFQKDVIEKLTRIDEKLSDYSKVKSDTNEALTKSRQNECDLKDMKDNSRWLWRTAAGALIAAIVNLIGLYVKK